VCGGVTPPPPPNNSNVGQRLKVGQNGGKTGKNLVKVWDKRWSKLPKIRNFNNFKAFVTFAMKKLEILLFQNFFNLFKILGNVGQNMTTPPPQ
jgi:hypothetical protein